jgi:hypothetical protein
VTINIDINVRADAARQNAWSYLKYRYDLHRGLLLASTLYARSTMFHACAEAHLRSSRALLCHLNTHIRVHRERNRRLASQVYFHLSAC